ncbi:hypothetical protein B0H13DRAFT_1868425 [Mycena leptocephala]|nr:hypothetical protein B0H13DRAFT_1868425 [Mycena leptocephala]
MTHPHSSLSLCATQLAAGVRLHPKFQSHHRLINDLRRLDALQIEIFPDLNEISAIDLDMRGGGEYWHEGERVRLGYDARDDLSSAIKDQTDARHESGDQDSQTLLPPHTRLAVRILAPPTRQTAVTMESTNYALALFFAYQYINHGHDPGPTPMIQHVAGSKCLPISALLSHPIPYTQSSSFGNTYPIHVNDPERICRGASGVAVVTQFSDRDAKALSHLVA